MDVNVKNEDTHHSVLHNSVSLNIACNLCSIITKQEQLIHASRSNIAKTGMKNLAFVIFIRNM